VRGAESENLSRDVAERALAALRSGQLVDVPESGHYLPWENPEGLRAAIRAFLLGE
jgi:pimeloyl-ACP methyl ester carboxylesterase